MTIFGKCARSHHDSAGSGALLVHELVLHLSDGLLHRLGVQPLHLSVVEEPNLTKHLTRDLHRGRAKVMNHYVQSPNQQIDSASR